MFIFPVAALCWMLFTMNSPSMLPALMDTLSPFLIGGTSGAWIVLVYFGFEFSFSIFFAAFFASFMLSLVAFICTFCKTPYFVFFVSVAFTFA